MFYKVKGDKMKNTNEYLKIKAAAEFLSVTAQTLRNWERKNKFVAYRHPMNNYRLYKKSDLEAVLKIMEENKK